MVDIVQAFRYFIDRSNPKYREEVVYNTAKQLYWNLTQSRVLFQADFIELLKEYKKDFLLNPYIHTKNSGFPGPRGHSEYHYLRAYKQADSRGVLE